MCDGTYPIHGRPRVLDGRGHPTHLSAPRVTAVLLGCLLHGAMAPPDHSGLRVQRRVVTLVLQLRINSSRKRRPFICPGQPWSDQHVDCQCFVIHSRCLHDINDS